jgi:hypothetical protein
VRVKLCDYDVFQLNADILAYEVAVLAYKLAGGVGDLPKHP